MRHNPLDDPYNGYGRNRSLMHRVPGDGFFGRLTRLGTLPLVMLLLLLLGIAGLLQLADGLPFVSAAAAPFAVGADLPGPPAGSRG